MKSLTEGLPYTYHRVRHLKIIYFKERVINVRFHFGTNNEDVPGLA